MRTRMPAKLRVRQVAKPVSPGCVVGRIVAQSVVPKGMSRISMVVSPPA
jgi:hypothetical protein